MPAYTIGKQKRNTQQTINGPGVGSYNIKGYSGSRIKTSPSVSFNKAQRDSFKQKIGPAPNSYTTKYPGDDQKRGFSIKHRSEQKNIMKVPGPGQYNSNVKYPTKYYSFGRASRTYNIRDGPAPNEYHTLIPNSKSTMTFSKQKRQKTENNINPGPGQYQLYLKTEHYDSSPKVLFSKQKKFQQQILQEKTKESIPGPGSYDLSQFRKKFKGIKFNIGKRITQPTSKQKIPGPGHYKLATDLIRKRSPVATIGTSPRNKNYENDKPGPGCYQLPNSNVYKNKNASVTFSNSHHEDICKVLKQSPGPGSYNIDYKYKSTAYSITERHNLDKRQLSPGPQNYDPKPQKILPSSQKPVIGNQEKFKDLKVNTPGPGSYNYQVKNMSKTFYFDRSKQKQQLRNTVGPGQYKLKPFLGMYDGSQKQKNKDILYV